MQPLYGPTSSLEDPFKGNREAWSRQVKPAPVQRTSESTRLYIAARSSAQPMGVLLWAYAKYPTHNKPKQPIYVVLPYGLMPNILPITSPNRNDIGRSRPVSGLPVECQGSGSSGKEPEVSGCIQLPPPPDHSKGLEAKAREPLQTSSRDRQGPISGLLSTIKLHEGAEAPVARLILESICPSHGGQFSCSLLSQGSSEHPKPYGRGRGSA